MSPGPDARAADGPGPAVLVAGVHRLLAARGATVAVAESLTGGLVAAALTDQAGSSETFRGGVVAYATELKATLLGVDAPLLATHGPVHPEVARQMARGVADRLGATIGIATTGVAGPGPSDGQPAGTVFVAVWGFGAGPVRALHLRGDRAEVRRQAVAAALELAREVLDG